MIDQETIARLRGDDHDHVQVKTTSVGPRSTRVKMRPSKMAQPTGRDSSSVATLDCYHSICPEFLRSPRKRRQTLSKLGLTLIVTLAVYLLLAIDSSDQHQSFQSPAVPVAVGGGVGGGDPLSAAAAAAAQPDLAATILPPIQQRPNVRVNIREWSLKISEDIRLVSNRTNCAHKIEKFYERESEYEPLDPVKLRENIINQINLLLAQHRAAVSAIVAEAEKLAMGHTFVKDLRVNYTDVHRIRNELDQLNSTFNAINNQLSDPNSVDLMSPGGQGATNLPGGQQGGTPQFTSIGGGTPVAGPPEWQTPVRSIVMQVNRNFGDLPVNTSMSAVHVPLPIYPGSPAIMNGIAWTERLDSVFRRNFAQFAHVHHQYYGSHLGFLRTFPAHRWRIPRMEPDLFDARTRPWYVGGASTPKDMVILVDSSGSMTGLRREIAKGVVFEILDTLTVNDHFTVLRFSETVTPVGLPKCNLKRPRLAPQLEEQCGLQQPQQQQQPMMDKREWNECSNFRRQWESRGQYLRDHPNIVLGKNGSYMPDDAYYKSIHNVTEDIRDAYLLPATSRNIRYMKSNFSMPTAGIANFTHALMAAFELLQAYNRTGDLGAQCNQAIMLITDGAIRANEEVFNRYNYPGSPVRVFTYMIGREVGDIRPTKAMACMNRGFYGHVINLGEVREQVQKYLPVLARPLILSHQHPIQWTNAYGDETYQVLTDWVLEIKRRERARIMLNEERERLYEANSSDVINIELTNIPEYDALPSVDEELKNRIICEDANDDPQAMDQSLLDEIDPLGYNELTCHWTATRRANLLTSVMKPVFDQRNTSIFFERVLSKNVWVEQETYLRNAQLLGVAAVDLRIVDIMKAAPSHLLGPNGYAILLGQNAFVMHHPDLRALLEDPFDKQSKILKPYYNAVDLSHIEQVYHNDTSLNSLAFHQQQQQQMATGSGAPDTVRRKPSDETRLFKLREASVRRSTGVDSFYVKRAVDCRRRPHIRKQSFYFGPIKDTPFSLMLALPQSYGLNRVSAKLPLDSQTRTYLSPSAYDLWTTHPDYRYCELASSQLTNKHQQQQQQAPIMNHQNESLNILIRLIDSAAEGNTNVLNEIEYADLTQIGDLTEQTKPSGGVGGGGRQRASSLPNNEHFICDKELFPSLLFDAKATFEPPDSTCGTPFYAESCDDSSFFRRGSNQESCAKTPDQMRSKLAQIYGLEMSFLATRSGLTRTRVFDLSLRTKKLAELFIKRHNKAVDEAWYSRTVDWNMRFNEEASVISVPFNANIRLIAKLRQRITQRHPAVNDTRANCDPTLDSDEADGSGGESAGGAGDSNETTTTTGGEPQPQPSPSTEIKDQMLNDEPMMTLINDGNLPTLLSDEPTTAADGSTSGQQPQTTDESLASSQSESIPRINYNDYSSFDFLDLLANSSVHIAITQSVIVNKRSKQRTPVAVNGHLHDYAIFARRFLNSTSLNIQVLESNSNTGQGLDGQPMLPKVDICPGGACPTQCGFRNDTIDCLLVDNNGYIIVGEELPHIGRSLVDYDEKLMASLVARKVYHQVEVVDYQAICARSDNLDTVGGSTNSRFSSTASQMSQAPSSSSSTPQVYKMKNPLAWDLVRLFLANLISSIVWVISALYSVVMFKSASSPPPLSDLFAGESLVGQLLHWQRSVIMADAQSAIANQSLLALLPNKTYLRPCEKTINLYETRPVGNDPNRLYEDTPEYYVTKCGCSGWYVYGAVPQTNLMMLIVNTTSACRRCDNINPPAPAVQPVTPLGPLTDPANPSQLAGNINSLGAAQLPANINSPFGGGGIAPNKTTEDQVCAMLERDSQLYVQRPTSCMTSHPEEANIRICGGATGLAVPRFQMLLLVLLAVCCFSNWQQEHFLWRTERNER